MLAGRFHDAFYAIRNEAALGISVQGVAVFPGAPMRGGFVSAPDDLTRQIRSLLDGLSDHEGRDLHPMLVEQIEQAGDALVGSVLKECVRWQIGKTLLDGIRNDPSRTGDRLPSGLEHKREAYGQARAVRPKAVRWALGCCRCRCGMCLAS